MSEVNYTTDDGFVICVGNNTADTIMEFDFAPNRFVYVKEGKGVLESQDGSKSLEMLAGNLYDMAEFYRIKVKYTIVEDGTKWLSFNPQTKANYTVQLYRTGKYDLVIDGPTFIFAVENTLIANGKQIAENSYGRVNSTHLALEVPETSIALYVQKLVN